MPVISEKKNYPSSPLFLWSRRLHSTPSEAQHSPVIEPPLHSWHLVWHLTLVHSFTSFDVVAKGNHLSTSFWES